MPMLTQKAKACVELCKSCAESCLTTLSYCLDMGGPHTKREHMILLHNCAKICETTLNFVATGSSLQKQIAEFCAEVCKACAISCEHLAHDDTMKQCAVECQKCEKACRNLATT